MTSSNPKIGDVWLTYLRFTDHPEIGKVRPVVVVDIVDDSVVALKITSKMLLDNENCLVVSDLVSAGLRTSSCIRLAPPFLIPVEKLLREKPIGVLSQGDMRALKGRLDTLGQTSQ